ncbi:hypothetical protein [Trichocoleus sp. DQ-U1]|uniref:hypothetical protein n=1 Tax=Trichocoleus sp. DQ-U1 TaxID=2933926 RepID=UPI003296DD0E
MTLNQKTLSKLSALLVFSITSASQVAQAQQNRYVVDPSKPKAATCDPAYPDRNICIPKGIGNSLNCSHIPLKNITVKRPDPQEFDGNDNDGLGCEDKSRPLNRTTYKVK